MRAGKLRHRVTIEQPGQAQDPTTGEMIPGWQAVATVWASIEPLSVRDFMAAQAAQSEVSARITIRHREGLDPTMRITHRGKAYKIEGLLPDDRSGRQWLTIPVSEGVSDGS